MDAGDGVPELSPEDVEVGVEADEEHDILYEPEAGESETTRLKSSVPEGNLEHEPEAKRRKLANVHRSKARFTQLLRLQKYDGSLQKVTKMLPDLEYGVFPSCPTRHRLMSVGANSTIHSTVFQQVSIFIWMRCSSPIFIARNWFMNSWTPPSTAPLACG